MRSQPLPMSLRLLITTILLSWSLTEQCFWGKGPKKDEDDDDGPPSNHGVGNEEPNEKDMWNGWKPPPGMPNFTTYMDAYRKKLEEMQRKNGEFGALMPKGDWPGWPKSWIGVGPGEPGMPPPPWAFVPINAGKPKFCFQQPVSGNPAHCPDKYPRTRYGYNPFMDECQKFDYRCNGNQNNFRTKAKCEEMCMGGSESTCNPDSMLTIDDLM